MNSLRKYVGHIYVGCPTCADDVLFLTEDPEELQVVFVIAKSYSGGHRFTFHPQKTQVVCKHCSSTVTDNVRQEWNIGDNVLHLSDRTTVMVLSFWTDRPGQTVQTQRSSLIWVYTVCHSVCIVWTHYSMVEPHSSNFRVITTNFLGVRIFRKFTVLVLDLPEQIKMRAEWMSPKEFPSLEEQVMLLWSPASTGLMVWIPKSHSEYTSHMYCQVCCTVWRYWS